MHPFGSHVLRCYYKQTGWNEDNLYANLTRSSNAILDFSVPVGLHLSLSKSPNGLFNTSYSMTTLPSLSGSVGYIFTSCPLSLEGSDTVRFKDMIDRFKVYTYPRRPVGKEQEWLAGERVDKRDYLLYGRLYLPTRRLDALYSTRLSATMQAVVAAISEPPSTVPLDLRAKSNGNAMFSLQHDVGKWCTEYTYSAEDSMWGLRVLHNFGRLGVYPPREESAAVMNRPKRIDEEDAVDGGLQGRVSAGAEVYFSAKEKSAGVSTGVRFSTVPDATPPSYQITNSMSLPSAPPLLSKSSQPPTTVTALFNPMLGHISAAYAARVSSDLSLASRFAFNVYSYQSEWTMGAEWWVRRATSSKEDSDGVPYVPDAHLYNDQVHGVIKARASTNNDISLMWEGKLRNMLVSLGIVADLSRAKPIRAIGLDVSYFSSGQ
ncbi:mitochondrial distribution and morphology protein 10 [Pterulicium gracile]|uniref:Mitochondrial distribution and morphology protein 10 n=1 Tax=Pterulicium gracile TaxID=1884261 RepID=A0A5C3QUP7_9AGAR|nr:mitochondrial distribution and morphology protein 10 [Pterula gracilis]